MENKCGSYHFIRRFYKAMLRVFTVTSSLHAPFVPFSPFPLSLSSVPTPSQKPACSNSQGPEGNVPGMVLVPLGVSEP